MIFWGREVEGKMVVGVLHLSLYIPDAFSLKDKRRVVRQAIDQIRRRFNVSVCEVGNLDAWQMATLAVACVARSNAEAHEVLNKVLNFVEGDPKVEVGGVKMEIW